MTRVRTRRNTTSIRLSDAEEKAIEKAADCLGRSFGEFIRIASADKAFEVLSQITQKGNNTDDTRAD